MAQELPAAQQCRRLTVATLNCRGLVALYNRGSIDAWGSERDLDAIALQVMRQRSNGNEISEHYDW